jgi:cysteine-rich repeat protein
MRACARPGCGDGLPGASEPCDDGNLIDGDSCSNACTLPCRDVAVFEVEGQRIVIDRYEASRPDATAVSEGLSTARACSRVGVLPWSQASLATASAACAAAGGHLCTRDEWLFACAGETQARPYPYGYVWQSGACNGYRGAFNLLARSGEFAGCETPEGVFDLVGNLHEWVSTGQPSDHASGGSYRLTALAVSQRLDSCWADVTVVPAIDVGFRCCGP